mgnify:CR=1 FL=1
MSRVLTTSNGMPVSDSNPLPVKMQAGGGSGDMEKAVYDTNDDGKVDAAETADSVAWSGVTGKPSTYPPAAHNHDGEYQPAGNYASADHNHDGEYAPANHTHAVGDVEGLQAQLDDIISRLEAIEGAE